MKRNLLSSMKHFNHNQRMLPFYKIIMWMSVFLLFFTVENVYSQVVTLNCANSDTCLTGTEWSNRDTILDNMGSGITGKIIYRRRVCNGVEQYIVEEIEAFDNGLHLDKVNIFHYTFSTFSDLVDVKVIQNGFNNPLDIAYYNTHNNPNNTRRIVQIYKASCGIWVKCRYNIDSTTKGCCGVDSSYTIPWPHDSISLTYDYYRWQPCGSVCCKKTYETYKTTGVSGNVVIHIKSLFRNKSQPKCTDEWKYGSKPCEDGC
jgi:hypothetical protein